MDMAGVERHPSWVAGAAGAPAARLLWLVRCVGLAVVQATRLETCHISCTNDPRLCLRLPGRLCRCSVWQFNPGQVEGGCWQGQGHHCETRNGFETVPFSGGRGGLMRRGLRGRQRIQHGSVRARALGWASALGSKVMKKMTGIEVHNLRPIGKLNGDEAMNIERCRPTRGASRKQKPFVGREVCYSDILCQFWQCLARI